MSSTYPRPRTLGLTAPPLPTGGRGATWDAVCGRLGLPTNATIDEVLAAAMKELKEGQEPLPRRPVERAESKIESGRDMGPLIPVSDEVRARGTFTRMRPASGQVVGLTLSIESRRLLSEGRAKDLGEAQRLAVRLNPRLLTA